MPPCPFHSFALCPPMGVFLNACKVKGGMALRFSDAQKSLCNALLASPLSLETLSERVQMKAELVQAEMKALMQLKLVALAGTPPQYALKEEVASELKRRKTIEGEDDNVFRIHALIEVQGVEETLVKKQVEKILANLQNEPFFRIYVSKMEDILKVEDKYTTFIDLNLSVRDFRGMVRFMFFYGPTTVEVVKPSKIEFTLDDFQNGLVDMTEMVHAYAEYIMGLLNRKQVEAFNTRLYEGVRQAHALKPKSESNPLAFPEDLPTV